MGYKRTDLALEKRQIDEENGDIKFFSEKKEGETLITELIFAPEGENETRYVTFSKEKLWQSDEIEEEIICEMISEELRRIIEKATKKKIGEDLGILIVGLGNDEITADAIGPQTVKKISVTRHLKDAEPMVFKSLKSCEISALAPGVLGQTGIETVELVRGAVKSSKPDAVIAIDALAALSCFRLGSVIQISDGGIKPGSGIGNKRKAIDREILGVPVISIGVPTMVESSTLVFDVLESAGIKDVDTRLKEILRGGKSFFVTPEESDLITKKLSDMIAASITKALVEVNI